jgi:hypothetical protein
MKHTSKVRLLTRTLIGLFVTKKPNATFLNHKDEYYKHYWFNKKLCDGITIVAAIERTNKKQAAELLMKAGLSSYMGAKVTEYIENKRVAREQNQKLKLTRFVTVLRRCAKERGMNISKFI